ncbi:MAG TPA: hypothetical protein VMH41_05700 [Mycobacteriales bacterium]|nr:hypothetical protein [Mycobacteriales bacterium]
MHRAVERRKFDRRSVLHLVNDEERPDAKLARSRTELSQKVGQVGGGVAAAGMAACRIDLNAEV